jgi:hypothetical protein
MKLSVQTINVLKNFSGINRSIVFRPGTTLATMSSNKTIVAKATVPDEFTNTFGIYQLNEFIGALSLIDNPDLDFGDNFVTIRGDGDSEIVFHYAEISTIISPPEKDIKLPTVDVEVSLSNKDIQKVSKALNLFGLPELAIVGDGNRIWLQALDVKNPSANVFKIQVSEGNVVFRAVFRAENMRMVDGDYNVRISSKGISQFIGTDVTYWIANEASSTF